MRKQQHDKPTEFGGSIGNLLLIIFLPVLVYYLYFCLRYNGGNLFPTGVTGTDIQAFAKSIVPTLRALWMYGAWLGFQALLQIIVPGKTVYGRELSDGSKLPYKMNGLLSFIITLAVFWAFVLFGVVHPEVILEELGSLITTVIAFTFVFSVFLYVYGKRKSSEDAQSESVIHTFFMGYTLNPRIGRFDLKLFFEARPSLIGWIILSFTFAAVQFKVNGGISVPMVMVCTFQLIYILDYFIHEEAILSTMDVVHDRFGFMLCFGDAAWVPFTYSVQAFYLLSHLHALPVWAIVFITLFFGVGYFIFRITNLQKHRFRQDPARPIWGKSPEYIQTEQGNKLLVSGFWGWSRHFNYVGDIIMALAWSLPCLFNSLLPYFYPVYFTLLLVHRERRDYGRCSAKYGEDWKAYCRKVRWRIMPGIY